MKKLNRMWFHFEQRPWMKAAEITDKLVEAIKSGNYDFLRTNYPNGDMVGHTGNFGSYSHWCRICRLAAGSCEKKQLMK